MTIVYTKEQIDAQAQVVGSKIKTLAHHDSSSSMIELYDSDGNLAALIDGHGGLRLSGLNGSVQSAIGSVSNTDNNTDLFTFVDVNGAIAAKIDSNGVLSVKDIITENGSTNKAQSDSNAYARMMDDRVIATRDSEPRLLTTNIFTHTELGAAYAFAPSLCRLSKNEYLVFCEARHGGDFGISSIFQRKITVNADYTITTSAKSLVCDYGTEGGQDFSSINPTSIKVRTGAHAERVYLYYIKVFYNNDRNETFYKYSDNDGATWSSEVPIAPFIPDMATWRIVAVGTGHAIQLRYGTHAGRIVLPCWHGDANYPSSQVGLKSFLLYSDDGGVTYQVGAESNVAGSNECQVAELENGDILLMVRDGTVFKKTELSKDSGITLQDTKSLSNVKTVIVQSGLHQFRNDYDLSVPKVIISTPSVTGRYDLALHVSYDGSEFRNLKTIATGLCSYSDLAPIDESHVMVVYSAGVGAEQDKSIFACVVNLKSLLIGG